jgi:hypothetical protein
LIMYTIALNRTAEGLPFQEVARMAGDCGM